MDFGTLQNIDEYSLDDYYYDYIFFTKLVRKDYLNRESEFYKVDKRIEGRDVLKRYASLNCDSTESMRLLLLSDLHIGNNNFEDQELLENLYDFGIKNGVKTCIILGDLLDENGLANKKSLEYDLKRFKDIFPKNDEVRTFAILGNHDQKFTNIVLDKVPILGQFPYQDFRQLHFLNKNFYPLPKEEIELKLMSKGLLPKERKILKVINKDIDELRGHSAYDKIKSIGVKGLFDLSEETLIEGIIGRDYAVDDFFKDNIEIIKNTKYSKILKTLLIKKICLLKRKDYQNLNIGDLITKEEFLEYENNVTIKQIIEDYIRCEVDDKRPAISVSIDDVEKIIEEKYCKNSFSTYLSHRLTVSIFDRKVIINKAEDIMKHERLMFPEHDLFISGHLHQGFIYGTSLKKYNDKNILYVNCPSSSKINIGGTVGFVLDINYIDNKLNNLVINPIFCDSNKKLSFSDEIDWQIGEKNDKVLKKFNCNK